MKIYGKICLSLFVLSAFFGISFAWDYPIKQIIKGSCTTTENCTIFDLPIIENADYFSYKNDPLYRSVYTMLRGGTYYGGRDAGIGTHQGVDISSNTGTPVLSSQEGTVIFAGTKGNRGKVIVIEHERNGEKIRTTYAHMSKIDVEKGKKVKQGEKIGEVGSTGNSTGPHLHFQVEVNDNGKHPFFPSGCGETIAQVVNEGNCITQMRESTIDPIAFLESDGNLALFEQFRGNISTETTPQSLFISPKQIQTDKEIIGLLPYLQIEKITLSLKNSQGGFLEEPIQIIYDPEYISLTADKISVINPSREIVFSTKQKSGITTLTLTYQGKVLKTIPIVIADGEYKDKLLAKKGIITAFEKIGLTV